MELIRQHECQALVPKHRVHVASERTRIGRPADTKPAEPEIILIRNGETVEAIEVVCTCGQRIRMKCVF